MTTYNRWLHLPARAVRTSYPENATLIDSFFGESTEFAVTISANGEVRDAETGELIAPETGETLMIEPKPLQSFAVATHWHHDGGLGSATRRTTIIRVAERSEANRIAADTRGAIISWPFDEADVASIRACAAAGYHVISPVADIGLATTAPSDWAVLYEPKFSTADIAVKTGLAVRTINSLAKTHDLGRMIGDRRLFSTEDLAFIRDRRPGMGRPKLVQS